MYQVTKRDGTAARFEIGKISAAITKAFQALDKQFNPSVIDLLALRVTADFEPKIRDGRIAVEDIQDSVETVLSEAGYADVAKAYILYRKQREKVRNVNSTLLNYKDLVDDYLQINDWRVKENSTVTYSVGGLIPVSYTHLQGAADGRHQGRVPLLGQPPRQCVPPRQRHSLLLGHRRQRAVHGLRQHGR